MLLTFKDQHRSIVLITSLLAIILRIQSDSDTNLMSPKKPKTNKKKGILRKIKKVMKKDKQKNKKSLAKVAFKQSSGRKRKKNYSRDNNYSNSMLKYADDSIHDLDLQKNLDYGKH